MRESGMIRRIDELGRVVIPKEMRRTLRIKEGDPLEIYTDKEYLLFKKYSPITTINSYAQAVADGIEELMGKTCVVTDTDVVIYVSKGKHKDMIGMNISEKTREILEGRKSVVINKVDGGEAVPITVDGEFASGNQIIVPVVSNGDCYGSVVVFDRETDSHFSSCDVKFVQLGATLISKQFD